MIDNIGGSETLGANPLQPYDRLTDTIIPLAIDCQGLDPKDEKIGLIRDFFLRCLACGYNPSQLPDLQKKIDERSPQVIIEVINRALDNLDQTRYAEDLAAARQLLASLNFDQPQEAFGFLFNLGLLDQDSPMSRLYDATTKSMPVDIQTALAIKSF